MYSRALRLRPRVCTLPPAHGAQGTLRRVAALRGYQSSSSKKQCAAEAPVLDVPATEKPRPFAIERVGGRECHVSWTDRGIAKGTPSLLRHELTLLQVTGTIASVRRTRQYLEEGLTEPTHDAYPVNDRGALAPSDVRDHCSKTMQTPSRPSLLKRPSCALP